MRQFCVLCVLFCIRAVTHCKHHVQPTSLRSGALHILSVKESFRHFQLQQNFHRWHQLHQRCSKPTMQQTKQLAAELMAEWHYCRHSALYPCGVFTAKKIVAECSAATLCVTTECGVRFHCLSYSMSNPSSDGYCCQWQVCNEAFPTFMVAALLLSQRTAAVT